MDKGEGSWMIPTRGTSGFLVTPWFLCSTHEILSTLAHTVKHNANMTVDERVQLTLCVHI